MQVILLQDIKRFGQKGEIVEVADGYANAYLIPRKLARVAGEGDLRHSQARTQAQQAQREQQEQDQANQFKKFNKKKVVIKGKVSPSGKLFQAITASDISSQLPGLNPRDLHLKKGLKELGEHEVPYQVGKMKGHLKVVVER